MNVNSLFKWFDELGQAAKIVVTGAIVFAALSVFHSCGSQSNLDKFRKEYKDYRDSVAVVLVRSDSLARVAAAAHSQYVADSIHADSLSRRIAALNAANNQLHHKNDSLATIVLADTTLSPQARTLIISLRAENDSLRGQIGLNALRDSDYVHAIASLKEEVTAQTNRANGLDSTLRALPKGPKNDHLLGISFLPHISPTATFFVGVGTGVVAHVAVTKWLVK